MSQTVDSPAFCPVFQVFDPDIARRRRMREIFLRCGLSLGVLKGLDRLEIYPDACSLVLLYDSLDEASDQLVDACVARGHGAFLYREDHQLRRVVDLLAKGAAGYLPWPFDCDDVRHTVRTAEESGHLRTRFLAFQSQARVLVARLSRREKQVLILVSAGLTSKDIAHSLGISARTIDNHRANIQAKLQLSPSAIMRLGIYAGLDQQVLWPSNGTSELTGPPGGLR